MEIKDFFYKYYTPQSTLEVLRNLTVKWSSPLEFNDPFDSQLYLTSGDDSYFESVRDLTIKELESVGSNLSETEKAAINRLVELEKKNIKDIPRKWREYARNARIFCVSETQDDLLMWAHYSDSHKGAVIKFRNIVDGKIGFKDAKVVRYSTQIPKIAYGPYDILNNLGKEGIRDFDMFFFEVLFTKSNHWSYEKEWRIVQFLDKQDEKLHDFRPILPEEIDGVYLGCRIKESIKEEILSLVPGKLKHIKVFESNKNADRFALDFIEKKI